MDWQDDQHTDLLIQIYLTAMEHRNPGARVHAERVASMAERLAAVIGFEGEGLVQIHRAGLLHDVGKLAVRDAVIRKPGPLTAKERAEVEEHATYGALWLLHIPALRPCAPAILHHHERWDGSGYPTGLAGQSIPLSARILAIVDVFDALTSDRVYRSAWAPGEALALIAEQSGFMFDPKIVAIFLRAAAAVGLLPKAIAA